MNVTHLVKRVVQKQRVCGTNPATSVVVSSGKTTRSKLLSMGWASHCTAWGELLRLNKRPSFTLLDAVKEPERHNVIAVHFVPDKSYLKLECIH